MIFKKQLQSKSKYLTLRYITKDGQEQVVVKRAGKKIVVSKPQELQNKSHRLYVSQTIKLPRGIIYMSKINLNREHGEISTPHQEVLRSAIPVYFEKTGTIEGILLLTMNIGLELEKIQKNIHSLGRTIYITNDQGDYLLHPEKHKTYGFDLGKRFRIQDDIPEINSMFLSTNHQKNFIFYPKDTDGKNVIDFTKLSFDPNRPERFIAVGITELYDHIIAKQSGLMNDVIMWSLVMVFVITLLAIFFAMHLMKPVKQLTLAMDNYANQKQSTLNLPENMNDEIGILVKSYNFLIANVEEAQEKVKQVNASLEATVEERTRKLEQSEYRQRRIVENIADGLITIDKKGTILSMNPAAQNIFGYNEDEICDQNIKSLMPEPYLGSCPRIEILPKKT